MTTIASRIRCAHMCNSEPFMEVDKTVDYNVNFCFFCFQQLGCSLLGIVTDNCIHNEHYSVSTVDG